MDYTHKIQQDFAKSDTFDKLDYTPVFVPTGFELPETTQSAIARIMLSSGAISLDDYQKMIGVTYDGDFDDEDEFIDGEDYYEYFDDRFAVSQYAQYEDEIVKPAVEEVNNDPKLPLFDDKKSEPEPVKDTDAQDEKKS